MNAEMQKISRELRDWGRIDPRSAPAAGRFALKPREDADRQKSIR
jgi:hypothetical protein